MNWEAIGAVGESVSALALLLVLVQVRHARSEVRRSISQSRGESLRQLTALRATNQNLLAARLKASEAVGSRPSAFVATMTQMGLTREDAAALSFEEWAWFSYRTVMVRCVGDMSPEECDSFDLGLRRTYGLPGVSRIWYETSKDLAADRDAIRYIDSVLAQPE